ncbi:MAG: MFS transporter, partial [Ignavibacteria bacterium]
WVIKPFWSPVVELLKSKRLWILIAQFSIGISLAGVALTIPADNFIQYTLAFFWLMAFSSATHDIAVDGFYMLALDHHDQAWFIGIRNTFYRFAFIFTQGFLVILAGQLEVNTGDIQYSWTIMFIILAILFLVFLIYHLIILPHPISDSSKKIQNAKIFIQGYFKTFISFFHKKNIIIILAFLLFYRFGEAQLVKLASPFLLDIKEAGGLALSTTEVGFVYGTVGIVALTVGGLLGGFAAARHGLKYWLWWMLAAINIPNAVYIFLAYTQTSDFLLINICVAVEQFGYGFGFTAFLLYLIYIAEGDFKTSHYAIGTGFMALGMMLPGMFSGWLQELIGYKNFFVWVMISTIPAFIIAKFIHLDPDFGKKSIAKED